MGRIDLGWLALLALLAAPSSAGALSLPSYEIVALGLTDAGHTRSDGHRASEAELLTDSGVAGGSSERFVGSSSGGRSAWLYDSTMGTTARLGFTDAAHTDANSRQQSGVRALTEDGYALGFSTRYLGFGPGGLSAWIHDSATGVTTRLGYFDAVHVRSDGYQQSIAPDITGSWVAGWSRRFVGASSFDDARSTWIYDIATGTTTRTGLFDAEHTSSAGLQDSIISRPNASGDAVGLSSRYAGGSQNGQSAYHYDSASGANARIGFFDAVHTGAGGLQLSHGITGLSDSGYTTGISSRFNGATSLGSSAWLYNSATAATTRIGLFDGQHTKTLQAGSYQESRPGGATESGYVTGTSARFVGITNLGQSSWLHDARLGTTTRIGLLDAEHTLTTRVGSLQYSEASSPTESGYVSGLSYRYSGNQEMGGSAWLYDAALGTTTRIGFYDAEHTLSDGSLSSFARSPTEDGSVAGTSWRAAGGQSAWLYDSSAGTTVRLGLFDSVHTLSGGYQGSMVTLDNDAGYFAGTSVRNVQVRPGGPSGSSAWIYDANAGLQHSIVLSERSDGYALASVSFLSDDGFALGSYELFDPSDASLGLRAFAWTADDGAVDLGALVAGGLGAAGWSLFEEAIGTNALAQIFGQGQLANGSDLAFLLTPVPEPGSLTLWLTAVLAGFVRLRSDG